jgi:hypothetical protein
MNTQNKYSARQFVVVVKRLTESVYVYCLMMVVCFTLRFVVGRQSSLME